MQSAGAGMAMHDGAKRGAWGQGREDLSKYGVHSTMHRHPRGRTHQRGAW